eukprot:g2223.t1
MDLDLSDDDDLLLDEDLAHILGDAGSTTKTDADEEGDAKPAGFVDLDAPLSPPKVSKDVRRNPRRKKKISSTNKATLLTASPGTRAALIGLQEDEAETTLNNIMDEAKRKEEIREEARREAFEKAGVRYFVKKKTTTKKKRKERNPESSSSEGDSSSSDSENGDDEFEVDEHAEEGITKHDATQDRYSRVAKLLNDEKKNLQELGALPASSSSSSSSKSSSNKSKLDDKTSDGKTTNSDKFLATFQHLFFQSNVSSIEPPQSSSVIPPQSDNNDKSEESQQNVMDFFDGKHHQYIDSVLTSIPAFSEETVMQRVIEVIQNLNDNEDKVTGINQQLSRKKHMFLNLPRLFSTSKRERTHPSGDKNYKWNEEGKAWEWHPVQPKVFVKGDKVMVSSKFPGSCGGLGVVMKVFNDNIIEETEATSGDSQTSNSQHASVVSYNIRLIIGKTLLKNVTSSYISEPSLLDESDDDESVASRESNRGSLRSSQRKRRSATKSKSGSHKEGHDTTTVLSQRRRSLAHIPIAYHPKSKPFMIDYDGKLYEAIIFKKRAYGDKLEVRYSDSSGSEWLNIDEILQRVPPGMGPGEYNPEEKKKNQEDGGETKQQDGSDDSANEQKGLPLQNSKNSSLLEPTSRKRGRLWLYRESGLREPYDKKKKQPKRSSETGEREEIYDNVRGEIYDNVLLDSLQSGEIAYYTLTYLLNNDNAPHLNGSDNGSNKEKIKDPAAEPSTSSFSTANDLERVLWHLLWLATCQGTKPIIQRAATKTLQELLYERHHERTTPLLSMKMYQLFLAYYDIDKRVLLTSPNEDVSNREDVSSGEGVSSGEDVSTREVIIRRFNNHSASISGLANLLTLLRSTLITEGKLYKCHEVVNIIRLGLSLLTTLYNLMETNAAPKKLKDLTKEQMLARSVLSFPFIRSLKYLTISLLASAAEHYYHDCKSDNDTKRQDKQKENEKTVPQLASSTNIIKDRSQKSSHNFGVFLTNILGLDIMQCQEILVDMGNNKQIRTLQRDIAGEVLLQFCQKAQNELDEEASSSDDSSSSESSDGSSDSSDEDDSSEDEDVASDGKKAEDNAGKKSNEMEVENNKENERQANSPSRKKKKTVATPIVRGGKKRTESPRKRKVGQRKHVYLIGQLQTIFRTHKKW